MIIPPLLKKYAQLIWHIGMLASHWILDTLIAPPQCAGCSLLLTHTTILCAVCASRIQPIVSYALPLNKNNKMYVYALAAYEDPLKRLILAKSWNSLVASKQMGELLWRSMGHHCNDIDYIVPIPLHWTRYAQRGYNQAEVIAQILSKHSKKPVVPLLKRIKKTQYQASLGTQERQKNIKNALQLNPAINTLYYNKRVLLVDDLMTTGATLENAAKTLSAVHPVTLKALVICRVI